MEKIKIFVIRFYKLIFAALIFLSFIVLIIWNKSNLTSIQGFIVSLLTDYLTTLQEPLAGGLNSLIRFTLILMFFLLSLFSIFVSLKAGKYIGSMILFIVLNVISMVIISQSLTSLIYYFGVLIPLLILVALSIISRVYLLQKNKGKSMTQVLQEVTKSWLDNQDKQLVLNLNEEYVNLAEKMEDKYARMSEAIKNSLKGLNISNTQNLQAIEEELNLIKTDQQEINRLNLEIERWKQGYNFSIIKSFFKQLYVLRNRLMMESQDPTYRVLIEKLFGNFFSNFNLKITTFIPKMEMAIKGMSVVGFEDTDDPQLDKKIHQVITQGLVLDEGEVIRVIEDASVIVYSFNGGKING